MPRTSWLLMTARPPETGDSPAYTVMLQRPLLSPAARQRVTLGTQVALLVTGVTALTVLLVGLVLLGLVKGAAESQARDTLAGQANLAATATAERTQPLQLARALRRQGIDVALVPSASAAEALRPAEIEAVAGGRDVSAARDIGGRPTYIEARPTTPGAGIVLWQQASLAEEPQEEARRRYVIALALGLAVGAVGGLLLARQLARPLQRAARTARRMSAGVRDVRLSEEGPAELAELADAMNQLAAALATSERRQRDFLVSVSHELRTPLAAVKGYAEALADGVIPAAEVGATGSTMLAEAQRLDRLVADLLDLARLGAQDFRVDLAEVDLVTLVEQAGQVWRDRCARNGIALAVEAPQRPIVVYTDATRVRQIVDGLAENALRVTPAGAPIVFAVRVEGIGPGSVGVLEVRDGGPGLTPEDLAVAFERSALYERYRGVRRVGTGVGLALVAGLAERLGGTADAGQAAEGGASFTVRLPLPPSRLGSST
ncbi:MAG TPA: HAMP domain-containing sensor histidine kinase, partial [Actinomycetes bacterium]|nr:HAMP domain-containing sensor histidine kinase [Actinomycetes bacterium]